MGGGGTAEATSQKVVEAAFSDREYARSREADLRMNPEMFQKYARPRPLPVDWREWSARWLGPLRGKRLLDLGCGMGEEAVYFATLGAEVVAVDISATGLALARQRAAANDVGGRVLPVRMAGEELALRSGSVDLVHGLGILHHLRLSGVLPEIRRVLRPEGRGVFLEPVDFTRIIPRLKRWVPVHKMATTPFERHLGPADLEAIRRVFPGCQVREFYLLARFRTLVPARLAEWLKWADCFLLTRSGWARRCASGVVIQVQASPEWVTGPFPSGQMAR